MQRAVLDGWFADILPDLNQEDPDVAQYEIQNALWWVGETGFDGIRQDTLPYVPRTFWRQWSAALRKQYPRLRIVGEVFDGDPAIPSFFQGNGIDTVFDFPTYFNIREVFARGGSIDAFGKTLAKDRFYSDPSLLVTFLGLHDVARFMNEPGASAAKLKLAFTYLATTRGIPMIYYGDEIGMPGGEDPDNRRDFPGGWPGDANNAFEPAGRFAQEQVIFSHVQKLLALRAQIEPLRRGKLIDLAVTQSSWAFGRQSPEGTAIVVINNSTTPADLSIPVTWNGTYNPQLAAGPPLTISDGQANVHLPAISAEIYFRK
jgi:glycosidase